ncbi:MAG: 5-formyltetrahydrofolate cyclo-ligase [Gammaproteobacteria bacterium]
MPKRVTDPESPEEPGQYSSPPCSLHEFDAAATAPGAEAEPNGWEQIRAWRKSTRERLIAQRVAAPPHVRRVLGQSAKLRLEESVDLRQYTTIGIYWPIRGEFDVRDIARKHLDAGCVVGLPVIVERSAPVEFWKWRPGIRMQTGIWDIPIPAEREVVSPDLLIIPLVGFDTKGYRLGYGGGYYDRTIAAAARRPFRVGLGYTSSSLATIYPQPHDIPMNLIVTDKVVQRVTAE